jgi:hypothetical protein
MATPAAAGRMLRVVLIGAALGALWGITARIWMRMISEHPDFTWTGSLMIVGFSAWLGLGVGLVYATRGRGHLRWLRLLGIPGLALFASPGMAFAPAFLLGSAMWNRARQRWLRRTGIGLGLVAVLAPTLLVWNDERETELGFVKPLLDQAEIGVGFGVLSLALAYGGTYLWRPAPSSVPVPVTADPALSNIR